MNSDLVETMVDLSVRVRGGKSDFSPAIGTPAIGSPVIGTFPASAESDGHSNGRLGSHPNAGKDQGQ